MGGVRERDEGAKRDEGGETMKEETLKKRETWKGSAGGGVSVSVRSGQEKRVPKRVELMSR